MRTCNKGTRGCLHLGQSWHECQILQPGMRAFNDLLVRIDGLAEDGDSDELFNVACALSALTDALSWVECG